MIVLQEEQMEKFKANALQSFIDDMALHCHEFSPGLSELIGEKQLNLALMEIIANAKKYGFTYKGPVQLYIDLSVLFGSYFDKDPMFSEFAVILHDDSNQMFRAEQLHLLICRYLEKIHGSDNENIDQAIISLTNLLELPQSEANIEMLILKEFKTIFPHRAAYVGDKAMDDFIQTARDRSAEYRLPPVAGAALLVILMSMFGYGCTQDKLYPWISKILLDEKVQDPLARMERLQRKALIWLKELLKAGQLEQLT